MPNFGFPNSGCAARPVLAQAGSVAGVWIPSLTGLALTIVITGLLLHSTVSSMVSIWYGSNTYSYGLVVVPICALLVWRRRSQLREMRPATSFAGVALYLLFAVLWLAGNMADAQMVQHLAFIAMLPSLAWAFLGPQVVRSLRFPLVFLFFAVPAGESLIEPLQRLTASFTVNAVRFSGIPAVQDGLLLSTPSGDWKIAEACSGIRYLISSIVVGVLVAGVAFRSWKRRVVLVLISAVLPVVTNALRAYLIVVLAYVSDNRIARGVDHIIYGWIFFSLVTAIFIAVALRWRESEVPAPVASQITLPLQSKTGSSHVRWCTVMVVLIVASTAAASNFLWSGTAVGQPDPNAWSTPADWHMAGEPDQDWTPSFTTIQSASFTKGEEQVSLYVSSDTRKGRGVELIDSLNAAGKSGDWDLLSSDYREANVGGKPATVAEYIIASGKQRKRVWMWYLIGNELTAKPYRMKWMQAKSRLERHPGNIFLFVILTPLNPQRPEATDALQEFAQGMSLPGTAVYR